MIALPVAGAFHTRFMAPAEEAMRAHAEKLSPRPTRASVAVQRRR